MSKHFSSRFKNRMVSKALNQRSDETIKEVAQNNGIGYSTLQNWIRMSGLRGAKGSSHLKVVEKRPEEWCLSEKLDIIVSSNGLNTSHLSALCRRKGIYPHHIEKWKTDFMTEKSPSSSKNTKGEMTDLRRENKKLKQELRRKEKALAETAALLVLKKKWIPYGAIWTRTTDNATRTSKNHKLGERSLIRRG